MADVSLIFSLLATNNTGGAVADVQAQLEGLAASNDELTASQTSGSLAYKEQMTANKAALAGWIQETKELEAAEKEAYAMADTMAKEAGASAEVAGAESKSAFEGFGETLKTVGETLGLFAGFEFMKSSVESAEQANVIIAQTDQILKSTGDASGLTATQVQQLSDKFGVLAGVAGPTVQNSLNQLLRSGGVQSALQQGSISASDLTGTLVNMAAAMSKGGSTADSLSGAAGALSKALADPFTAAKALTAAGDPLTASQVAQMAAFKKAGDTADAYKLILGSLKNATAGAAAANTTPLQKLGAEWDNLKIALGQRLMPLIDGFATDLMKLLPALSKVGSATQSFLGYISAHAAVFGAIAGGIALVVGGMQLWSLAGKGVETVMKVINALSLDNPWVLAIAAVVAALIFLMTKFSDVRTVVVDVVQYTLRILGDLAQFIVNTVVGSVELLLKALGSIPVIGGPFKTAANDVDNFRKTVDNAISAVQNLDVAAGLSDLSGLLQSMTNFGSTGGSDAANSFGAGLGAGLPAAVGGAAPKATAAVESLAQKVQDALTKFKNGIVQSFGSMGSLISNAMVGPNGSSFLVGNLQQQLNKAKQFATDISTLRKMGLNATSLNELISAGPDQGADAARQLATQGTAQIQQVNSLESQFNTLGNNFANTTANDEFGSSAAALKRNQVYLNFDMTGVSTDDFVKALRKSIRIKGGNVQTVLGGSS